jgi:Fuc2NAc and GlcNAc transferase
LGLALGGLSLQAGSIDLNLFWGWTILLGVFIVDASVTLLRRMARGGRVYLEAHRSHAYQHAARRLKSHRIVCLGVAAINVLWLGPLAVVVAAGKIHALLGVSIAYVPIVILVLHFNAGADRD